MVMRRARRLEARNGNSFAQETKGKKQAKMDRWEVATIAQWERQCVAMRSSENPRSREERRRRSRKKEVQKEQQNGDRLMVIAKVEVAVVVLVVDKAEAGRGRGAVGDGIVQARQPKAKYLS